MNFKVQKLWSELFMAKEIKLNFDEIQNIIENIKKRNYD